MDSLIIKRISGLITANSGLRIRESDHAHLSEVLWQRVKSCGLKSLEAYYTLLVQELQTHADLSFQGESSRPWGRAPRLEWHALFTQLTVNESYFFRDRNQFQLITQTLLPELIERKRQAHLRQGGPGLPTLRIWSAGCSTGEEVYSIAIALNELNFPWVDWDVQIVGTDISVTALSMAQQGSYGNWSFRQTDPILKSRYFRLCQQSLQVREDIRRRGMFQYGNLVKDHFPSTYSGLREMDLILCRNVFIYFDSAAIAHTLDKFYRTLAPKGYLITGHTELYGQDTSQFQLKIFPESLVYQRRNVPVGSPASPPVAPQRPAVSTSQPLRADTRPVSPPQRSAAPPAPIPVAPPSRPGAAPLSPPVQEEAIAALGAAVTALSQKDYAEAIQQALGVRQAHPQQFEAHLILATAYANMGNHAQAKQWCQQALGLQPLNVELHYLMAQIAEEEQNLDLAKEHLRRIIYIDAGAFRAYLDLASLYQQERNLEQVTKMERLALKTLTLLPDTTVIDPATGSTVLDWRRHLEKKLSIGHGSTPLTLTEP
jgi:chemotaxis protein methyltransferase CheR